MNSRGIIVVPCYNEASRLDEAAFLRSAREQTSTRFLFVNDGSSDVTADLINRLADERPGQLTALHLERNYGKAEAVRRGILAALADRCDYVGYWDADLATPLDEIPRFVRALARHEEVLLVMGVRLPLLGHSIRRTHRRHLAGRLFSATAGRVLSLPIRDTQCGAKVFRATPLVERVFREPFQSRWIFDVEILARWRCLAGGETAAAIYELPLDHWQDVAGSKLRGRDFLKAISELAAILVRYRLGSGFPVETPAIMPLPSQEASPFVDQPSRGKQRKVA